MTWRRSYDTPPPPIEKGSKFSQDADPRYVDIGGRPADRMPGRRGGPVPAVLHRCHRA